jgi:hypothetical protein
MVSCPILRCACRSARSSADRSGRWPFRPCLPLSRKSSRQAASRCASTPSSRDSVSRGSPRSNLSTASIFLPADGCTPARRRVLEASGWGELHEQLYLLSVRGRWAEMGRLVDEVLDACAVRGQPEQIPARLWPATARCATGSPSPPPAAGAGRTLGGGGRASPAAAARAVSGGLPRRDDRDGRGLLPAEPGAVDSDAHAHYLLCLP